MADAIVQTIKVQVEGTEEAAAEFKKVGDAGSEAFKQTQQAAATSGPAIAQAGKQASAGLGATGAALDETTKKAGLSRREMSALGKVMASFGGGEIAHAAVGIGKVGSALGALGAAALGIGMAASALLKMANAAKEAAEEGEKLSKLTANTPEQMQTLATVFEKGGTSAKAFADSTSKLVEELSKLAVVRGLSPEAAKGMEDAANDSDVLKRKILDLGTSTQQWVRSLNDVGKAIKDWSKETIDPLTTPATLAKAIKAAFLELPGAIRNGKPDMDKFFEFLNRTFNRLDGFGQLKLGEALKQLGIPPETIATITKTTEEYDRLKKTAEDRAWQGRALRGFAEAANAVFEFGKTAAAAFLAGPELIGRFVSALGNIGPTMQSVGQTINAIGDAVVKFFGGVGAAVGQAVSTASGQAWKWVADAAASVWEQVKAGAQQAYDAVVAFVTTAPANAWQWIVDTAKSAWDSVKQLGQQAYNAVVAFVTTAPGNAWQWIADTFQAVIDQIKQAFGFGGGQAAPAGGGGGGGGGFARGGLLGGRGSGTSDSNLAWVSRGEYILPAHAVRAPGVLQLLESLRLAGGHLRGIFGGMRFAAGGLIMPRTAPAFAGGGMNNVTIQFPGLPEITGLRASSDVVDELRRAAALGQVRSGGRKPSRYS